MIGRLLAAGWIAASLTACGGPSPTPVPSSAPVIVTFEVNGDERFKVLLTEPADIDVAQRLLAGQDAPGIPDGRIIRATGVNDGYSWSLDPNDIRFTDQTDAACDGSPSEVESGEITDARYCPSAAEVVSIDPVPLEPTPSAPSGS
jgi:hypothetical protein